MIHKSKSGSAYFQRGSAVKISIDNDNRGSWVSGTVLRRFSSRRFLVVFADEQSRKPTRKFVSLHRLRPLLPRQIYRPKLKSGNNRDCISELPDTVLLHIMSFMDTKDAVRTCVLSKRWKNLCKSLTSLEFSLVQRYKCGLKTCEKFASWVLTSRDSSHSLFNLTIDSWFDTEVVLLDRVVQYATCHNVQHLTMLHLNSSFEEPSFDIEYLSSIFYCQTLTSLNLSFESNPSEVKLPKSLHLPALKSLILQNFYFTANDNGCVEPFSNCHVLSTLFIGYCYLREDVLYISNLTLSILTLQEEGLRSRNSQIVLSTPNLSYCNINCFYGLKLSSTCNLSFIREVNMDMWGMSGSTIMSCLQVFVNVKILRLTSRTLSTIRHEYFQSPSRPAQPPQPPRFVRLESFEVKNKKNTIRGRIVGKAIAYLLQNSLMAKSSRYTATRRPL